MFKTIFSILLLTTPVLAQNLFKHENLKYQGLTEHGLSELKQIRDALRQRFGLFEQEFKGLSNIHHAATVARMAKANMFLYGPPGGAKSMLIQWLFSGEAEPAFQVQLHQMMSEQAFIGGQNFEAAKEGRFVLNTESSLANFRVALLDEVEKGNPATLAALLSLLNERKVLAGNQVFDAKTETVFATSNANLPEFFLQFLESGQRSTAPALLNRFQFKGFMYNWLSANDQADLDARREKKALCKIFETCANDAVFLTPHQLDWEKMRSFAKVLFVKSSFFNTAYNEMANLLRDSTNNAVRESELKHQKDRYNEPFVYFPSCDWTERLRQQIPDAVQYSALVDFLLSSWADDANLEKMTRKQRELGPYSLWRAFLITTTPGPGKAQLELDGEKMNINFGTLINAEKARDVREQRMIQNLLDEQNRFKSVYVSLTEKFQESIKNAAKFSSNSDESNQDFEFLVMKK
ncbi:MAG: AAA family ATPase [Myxococcaceae bacterium]